MKQKITKRHRKKKRNCTTGKETQKEGREREGDKINLIETRTKTKRKQKKGRRISKNEKKGKTESCETFFVVFAEETLPKKHWNLLKILNKMKKFLIFTFVDKVVTDF